MTEQGRARRPSYGCVNCKPPADDLGESGVDPYYGHGRINVARALGLAP